MPQNKSFLFENRDQETSKYAQALCHPARLQIIELLQQYDFLMHKELDDMLPLSASSISQHIRYLNNVKIIIKDEFAGVVGYRLNHIGWRTAKLNIVNYFSRVG